MLDRSWFTQNVEKNFLFTFISTQSFDIASRACIKKYFPGIIPYDHISVKLQQLFFLFHLKHFDFMYVNIYTFLIQNFFVLLDVNFFFVISFLSPLFLFLFNFLIFVILLKIIFFFIKIKNLKAKMKLSFKLSLCLFLLAGVV